MQKVISIDPAKYTSLLIELKPEAPEHIKGELGIDVSRHQGEINWDSMAAAHVGFAGIRATMGTTGKDSQFARNWPEAGRVEIQRLPYHYFINNLPGLPQLNNFLSALGDDLGELPPVLDVEPTSDEVTNNAIKDKLSNTKQIAIWLDECEKRVGRRPLIYTNLWAWNACTTIPAWSNNYPLWLAQHTNAPAPKVPLPWSVCVVWQYSRTGDIGGKSPIDLNRWGPY